VWQQLVGVLAVVIVREVLPVALEALVVADVTLALLPVVQELAVKGLLVAQETQRLLIRAAAVAAQVLQVKPDRALRRVLVEQGHHLLLVALP
jgi:hypothetical protein